MKVDELRQRIEWLPDLSPNLQRFTWEFRQQDLRDKILKHDPEEFLTWPIVKESLFTGNASQIEPEYAELFSDDNRERWINAITEWDFGNPELMPFPVSAVCKTSGNLIQQAYHLKTWEDTTGKRIDELKSIIEFGGGYGAMALVCRQLGFEGQYIIVDLPEFSLLQKYYLSNTIGLDNIKLHTSWDKKQFQADLLIACCSLSEVKWKEKRDTFLSAAEIKHYLVVYQPVWDRIDNHQYFKSRFLDGMFFENKYFSNHWYCVR